MLLSAANVVFSKMPYFYSNLPYVVFVQIIFIVTKMCAAPILVQLVTIDSWWEKIPCRNVDTGTVQCKYLSKLRANIFQNCVQISFTFYCSSPASVGISSKFRSFVPTRISVKCNTDTFWNWLTMWEFEARFALGAISMWVKRRNQMKCRWEGVESASSKKYLAIESWIYVNCKFSMWVQFEAGNIGQVSNDLIPLHDHFGNTLFAFHHIQARINVSLYLH